MKIYTKIILDKNNKLIEQEYYNYFGPISNCGIHYTVLAQTRSSKLMEKKAKREKKTCRKKSQEAS